MGLWVSWGQAYQEECGLSQFLRWRVFRAFDRAFSLLPSVPAEHRLWWAPWRNKQPSERTNEPNSNFESMQALFTSSFVTCKCYKLSFPLLFNSMALLLHWCPSFSRSHRPKARKKTLHARLSKNAPDHWNIFQARRRNWEELSEQINKSINLHGHPNHRPSK